LGGWRLEFAFFGQFLQVEIGSKQRPDHLKDRLWLFGLRIWVRNGRLRHSTPQRFLGKLENQGRVPKTSTTVVPSPPFYSFRHPHSPKLSVPLPRE
jgi:hypothetical protein